MTKSFKLRWILLAISGLTLGHYASAAEVTSTELVVEKISDSVSQTQTLNSLSSDQQQTSSAVNTSSNQVSTLEPVNVSQQTIPQAPVKSGFGVTYFMIGGQTLINNNTQMSSFDVFDSYISFNYKVSKYLKFAARPAFGYSVQGLDNKGKDVTDKSRVRDLSFVMTFTNLEEDVWPTTMDYKFQPRLYLPTSDGSQEQGMIARLRLEQEVNWRFARGWNLRTYLVPSYFFQRNTAFVSQSNGKVLTTAMADSEHGIEIGYDINKTFTILPCLHFIDKWSNVSPINNKDQFHSSVLDQRLGLGVNVTRDFSFVIGLQAEKDLIQTDKDIEYSYSFLTGGTFF